MLYNSRVYRRKPPCLAVLGVLHRRSRQNDMLHPEYQTSVTEGRDTKTRFEPFSLRAVHPLNLWVHEIEHIALFGFEDEKLLEDANLAGR